MNKMANDDKTTAKRILLLDKNYGKEESLKRISEVLGEEGYQVNYHPTSYLELMECMQSLQDYDLLIVHPELGWTPAIISHKSRGECWSKRKNLPILICSGWGARHANDPTILDRDKLYGKDVDGIYFTFSSNLVFSPEMVEDILNENMNPK